MKMKREDLKLLIKECLVEILSEGISDYITEGTCKNQVFSEQRINRQSPVDANKQENKRIQHETEERNKELVGIATRDPIMSSLLADTAKNTLPTFMNESRNSIARGAVEQVVADTDPADLFGSETSDRWASLALLYK